MEPIGGRIVGEIHLDFIGVSYTKDSFDKTQYNWSHAVEVIRGTPQCGQTSQISVFLKTIVHLVDSSQVTEKPAPWVSI